MLMRMMMLLMLHVVNDDDDKNFWWFIDVWTNVLDDVDVVSLSLSLDDVVLGYECRITFLLRGIVEIL